MFTKKFFKDLGERSARTFVQALVSYLTLLGLDIIQASPLDALWGGLLAAGYAVLMSLGAAFKEPSLESASFSTEVATAPDQVLAAEPGYHSVNHPRWTDGDPANGEVGQ